MSSLAELSLQMAITNTPANACEWSDARFDLWLRAARFAYAFLLLGERSAGDRAFEDRQTQVRDHYNYAVQELARAVSARRARDRCWQGRAEHAIHRRLVRSS
ncbi:hypothetical protein [Paraburkholderia sp. BR14374]|uniref:hypothetical protein n=1 Tax=Paraburkholderia sp. BR14374 TaxID=3237007 RepID=UPI0034CFC4C1